LKIAKYSVLEANATLDSMTKQCSEVFTDGEETQEQIVFTSASQHFSIALPCYQGHSRNQDFGGWYITSGSKSKNR